MQLADTQGHQNRASGANCCGDPQIIGDGSEHPGNTIETYASTSEKSRSQI
jgi:hypothetical protein